MLRKNRNKSFSTSVRFAFRLLSYAKTLTIFLIFLLLCNTLLMYIVPSCSKHVIDDVLNLNKQQFDYGEMILYGVLLVITAVFSNLERYISIKQSERVDYQYRSRILELTLKKDYVNFNQHSYGEVQTVMTSCIEDIDDSVYCFIETLFIYPIGLIFGVTYICHISYLLILLILLELGVNYLIMSKGSALQKAVSKENLNCEARYFSLLSNLFQAYENIRLFFIRKKAEKEHNRESMIFARSNVKMGQVNFVNISMALDVTEAVFNILTILLFYYLIKNGSNTIGGYFAFIAMKEAIIGDINGFIKLKVNKKTFQVAYEQLDELIPVEEYLDDSQDQYMDEMNEPEQYPKQDRIQEISLQDLHFAYGEDGTEYALNYKFVKDNCYLVLGDNGVGKSTLIRLLAGLLPENGRVLFNGDSDWKQEDRFGKIGILPQKINIFQEQVIEILLSDYLVLNEDICEKLKVRDIITDIQNQEIDTSTISTLSGGEKKRILLSLLFGLSHDVIILDEPFAELDMEAKRTVAELIEQFRQDRIIIVITHELPKELMGRGYQVIQMERKDGVVRIM